MEKGSYWVRAGRYFGEFDELFGEGLELVELLAVLGGEHQGVVCADVVELRSVEDTSRWQRS